MVLVAYPKHIDQMNNLRLFLPEDKLGRPIDVTVRNVNVDGNLLADANCTVFARGLLKVPKSGKYGFATIGPYTGGSILAVGNALREEAKTGNAPLWVVLRKGLVPFKPVVRTGNRYMNMKWLKPGDRTFSPIPPDVLFHEPSVLQRMKRRVR